MTTITEEKTEKKTGSKAAFDAPRTSIYQFDPMDLVLIGGAKLEGDERSKVDTDDGPEHPLWDRRTTEPLDEDFIANIDAFGVLQSIVIAKLDGKPVVVAGRHRVRAARVVNARRKKRGEPGLVIQANVRRGSDEKPLTLMGPMDAENEGRTDRSLLGKIERVKRYLDRGVPTEEIAVIFSTSKKTVEAWLAYDERATKEMKKAVESGRISISAATDIVKKTEDAEKQNATLEAVLASTPSGSKPSRRTAKAAAKKASKGSDANVGISVKREQKKLLAFIKKMPHSNASVQTLTYWEGVENAFALILGLDDVDKRLSDAVEKCGDWEPEKGEIAKLLGGEDEE